jgi:hypothetical protein
LLFAMERLSRPVRKAPGFFLLPPVMNASMVTA